jgi:hypothetical protein
MGKGEKICNFYLETNKATMKPVVLDLQIFLFLLCSVFGYSIQSNYTSVFNFGHSYTGIENRTDTKKRTGPILWEPQISTKPLKNWCKIQFLKWGNRKPSGL